MKAIEPSIHDILCEILPLSGYHFTPDEELSAVGLDSINSIRLIVELEEMFNITFDDEELVFSNFSTINNILNIISDKLAEITL